MDPRDANHLIAVWQQDRWSDGSSHGNLIFPHGGLDLTQNPSVAGLAGGNFVVAYEDSTTGAAVTSPIAAGRPKRMA